MKKIFVQYGAGNIGRGFIGALFSGAGYETRFIDVDDAVIAAMNERREYTVEIVDNEGSEYETVRGVSCVDGRDAEAASDAIAEAGLMATAVGVNILPRIAPVIASGLKKKWASLNSGGDNFFNIIICENLIDADKLLAEKIRGHLNAREQELFDKYVGLVEASIGRMVPVMSSEEKARDPLYVRVEPYCELPVDADAFKGPYPDVKGLCPASPFGFYIRRKLFIHNMGHATAAYLGFLAGHEYIWQAIGDADIRRIAENAMNESALALSAHYDYPKEKITEHVSDLLKRFGNRALGDTSARVGGDSFRKTGADDRLAGAAKFCAETGVTPVYICAGLAAALMFENKNDAGTDKLRGMIKSDGIEKTLRGHCGLDGNEKIVGRTMRFIGMVNDMQISGAMKEYGP